MKRRMNHFKYTLFALLLLLSTSINANTFLRPQPINNHVPGIHQHKDKPRMFLIAVIDSDDETIGKRCLEDLNSMEYIFDELDYFLDVKKIEPKIIQGSDFSKVGVNDALDNWLAPQQPTADDIVIFYYSGHGFRDSTDASKFPRMWLKTADDKDVETNNLRLEEDIYDRVKQMGAGFNLVLADCCNTTNAGANVNFDNVMVETHKREVHKRKTEDDDAEDDDQDYGEKLFLPGHPVSILVNAAAQGEFAAGKADLGGFFTYYFTEALEKCIDDNTLQPSWKNIFDDADKNASYWAKSAVCPNAHHTEQGRCVQTVTVKMDDPD